MKLSSLYFELNNTCNLNCIHCFQRANDEPHVKLSTEIVKKTIRLSSLFGAKSIILSGGEVLLYKGWKDLVITGFEKDMHVNLMTNGTLINQDVVDFFAIHKNKKFTITISIDGPNYELNDFVRGKGTFNKFMAAVKLFRKAELLEHVNIQCVVKKNICNNIVEIVDMARECGILSIGFLYIHNWGRAIDNWSLVGMSEAEILKSHNEIVNINNLCDDIFVSSFMDDLNKSKGKGDCAFGKELYIDSKGKVYGCNAAYNMENISYGNLNESSLHQILFNERTYSIQKKIYSIAIEDGLKSCPVQLLKGSILE